MSDLFRSEAVQHATRRLNGDVVLATLPSIWVLSGLLFSVIIGGTFFASQASYARKETVVGWLAPEGGIVRARAANGGTATEILVQEGDPVVAGQPIAAIRLSASTADGNVGTSIAASLEAQAKASQNRTLAAVRQFEANADRLQTQKNGLLAELSQLRKQIDLQKDRVALIEDAAMRARGAAAEGLLPQVDADARYVDYVDAKLSLSGLEQSATLLRNRIADIGAQMEAIPADKALLMAEAEAATAALAERTTQTLSANEYVVTSPIDGRVGAIPVRKGQSLAPGTSIAAISPHDSELFAELFVPSRAAGFIKPEQDVKLKYQAFPSQRFGAGDASIETVSLTVLAPEEVSIPGVQLQEPVFRVLARLENKDIEAYGESIPLRPGMMLSADIVIDRRTLAEWVLDPLYAAGRR